MARKNSSTIADEDLEASGERIARAQNELEDSPLDARMLDLDDEAESPFLRGQKRVPVRRGALPRKAASRVKIALVLMLVCGRRLPCHGFCFTTMPPSPGAFASIPATTSPSPEPTMSAARKSWT